MTTSKPSKTKFWLLAVAAVVLDQITKVAVLKNFEFAQRLNIIPDFFDLTLVYNTGAAFSFLAEAGGWQKYFFLALAAVICFYLARSIVKDDFGTWGKTGAAMIIGGAIGNVVDRMLHGYVVDYLDFHWNFLGTLFRGGHFPAFNLADAAITAGAIGLILDELLRVRRGR